MGTDAMYFTNSEGVRLAALLNRPAGKPKAYALFAHCFTCGKDIPAARMIAERLVAHGIAVLRFDFSGLGGSEGDFANTNFSSRIEDLVAAADHLRSIAEAPKLLIGHSLGGAAVLGCASRIEEVLAVATIGAPSDPSHVVDLFAEQLKGLEEKGEVAVRIAAREFKIRRAFLDDISEQNLAPQIASLGKALLIMHAPGDEIVGIENAAQIYGYAKHPKSFISLDGADHLLKRKRDAGFAADMLATWALRYLVGREPGVADERTLVVETRGGRFQQSVALGRHHLLADEPISSGGLDSGPSPYEFLLAGLGACTSMTLRLYADHKNIPLERASVALTHSRRHAEDGEAAYEGKVAALERIDREITLEGPLDEAQRARLLEIADKCPVHRTLQSQVTISTTENIT